jgi:hypothetical protein
MLTLEDLSRVAWSEKAVASGTADKVPQAVIGLLSPEADVRNSSYWQLDNVVVCQSDLYEAAYFLIPFLVRLLDEKAQFGRDRIYDLLYEIANGYAPPSVKLRTNEGDETTLKMACDREVRKGLNVFFRDTTDEDPRVCAKAKELVELLEGDT